MFINRYQVALCILLAFCLTSCSTYYFPHVYKGSERSIYMPTWQNRTNKLGLNSQIYQEVSRWFKKAESINLTKTRENADLILAGEIISIDLPSIAWDSNSSAKDINIKLGVRYVLKDIKSGKILWEKPREIWTEGYSASTINAAAEDEALDKIVNDLAESIYMGTLKRLRNLEREKEKEMPAVQQ